MKRNLKKHLPVILLIAGIGTEAIAVITAVQKGELICKTLKNEETTKQEKAVELVKQSWLPVSMTAVSMTSYICMFCLQKNEIKGLTAALTTSFAQYEILRQAFKDRYSEEEIDEMETPKFDPEVKELKSEQKGFWYINCPYYRDDDPVYNKAMIDDISRSLDAKMNRQEYLLINDILEEFDLDTTPEGKVLGWSKEHWTGLKVKEIISGQNMNTDELEYELWISWPQVEMIL